MPGLKLLSWLCPASATCKTDNEINHVNPSCVHLSPPGARSVFPGARAGCLRTAFVPQLGAIGPVSPLRAGHSCGEAGQLNSVGFHQEAGGREAGLGGAQTAGTRSTEQPPPPDTGHRPPGAPSQSNRKDLSKTRSYPGRALSGQCHLKHKGRADPQETLPG